MRTPETLTAAERAAALNLGEKPLNNKHEKAKQSARDALMVETPRNATANLDTRVDVDDAIDELSIHDIEPYKHNPRTKPNPRYLEIKDSIRADGITNMISVTRAPGAQKFIPYGGGNTRLKIARELLLEEGDQRFTRLFVKIKKWPGEAAVISAHLAENENRGEISFWEKAQGVAAFKREFEAESGKSLTAAELQKELKRRGLNYGVRMIQNFAFAVENLVPIGPWLRTEDLNTIIRPNLTAYIDAANKQGKDAAANAAIQEVLQMHGHDLAATENANAELEPAERKAVELDVESLLIDLKSVTARAIGFSVEKLENTLNPSKPQIAQTTGKTAIGSPSPPQPQPQQAPLGGFLAAVPTTPETTTPPQQAVQSAHSVRATPEIAVKRVEAAIQQINELVPIHDFFIPNPEMPFGYFVDIPVSIEQLNGQTLSEPIPDLRQRIWVFLAMHSGQFNKACARHIPADPQFGWTQAIAGGEAYMANMCLDRVQAAISNGMLFVNTQELTDLWSHPDLGSVINELTAAFCALRDADPARFTAAFEPLF